MLGVSISPIAFIIVQPSGVKLLPVNHSSSIDKLLDLVPDLIEKTTKMIEKKLKSSDKMIKDNIIVRVNDSENKDEDTTLNNNDIYNTERDNKISQNESTVGNTEDKQYGLNNDNSESKKNNLDNDSESKQYGLDHNNSDSKQYDIEYDETDI